MEERILLELPSRGNTLNVYLFADEIAGYVHTQGGSVIYGRSGLTFNTDLSPEQLQKLLVDGLGAKFQKTGGL